MQRRIFLKSSVLTGASLIASPYLSFSDPVSSTVYIPAYDTESESCMNHLHLIIDVHKQYRMPATFFIVANQLNEKTIPVITPLLNDPLFEIASHTTSHKVIIDHPVCGKAGDARKEVMDSKKRIEDVFGKGIIGFRPACGHANAFRGHKEILELVKEAGYKYTSSLLWGPDHSLPADLVDPFDYSADGFEDVWEIPGHGWHENLLKNNNKSGPLKIALWPNKWQKAIPKDFIKTPEEEFSINKIFIDEAKKEGRKHVTFIWHPWSLYSFDKGMKMLHLTFNYVKKLGLKTSTFADFYKTLV